MRPYEIDIDLDDVDDNGIVESETLSGGGVQSFTIGGALASGGVATMDYARQVICTTAANESARTFTITGTDADGKALTETMTGPNISTAETAGYFKTVTSITSDDDTAGAVYFGTVDEVMSITFPLDYRNTEAATYAVDVTGTINFTVEESFEKIQSLTAPSQDASWHSLSALASKTADTVSVGTINATAVRIKVNSHSSAAELQLHISQG